MHPHLVEQTPPSPRCATITSSPLAATGKHCWRREYSRGVEAMPGAVEDCQGVDDERQRDSGQEIAAAAEDRRSVDRRAQRAQELGGRPVGRPQHSVCRNPNSRVFWVDRPVDRSGPVCRNPTLGFSGSTGGSTGRGGRSTDRSTDSRVWAENYCFGKLSI